MPNKLPKFFDKHKICIICEGNEEYEYLKRLKDLNVWNEQYEVSLVQKFLNKWTIFLFCSILFSSNQKEH